MITYANMDGENPLNGDLPSFVPVETILKEDVDPISVDTDKPGSLMMNLETRELFLSNDAASPQQQQQQQQQQRQQRQQPQQQQFALSANEKSSNVAKELFLSNDAASPQQQHQQQQQFALSANEKSSNLAKELFLSNDAASPQQPQQQQQHQQQQQQQPQQQQFALSANEKSSNLAKDLDAGAMVVANKQWDCNLCSPLLKKALQRERLQALRQNPSYREMERLRQRSMMQLKRQDPSFRELERERQRSRMQLRRQDPGFRAMERERQRRRMRLKRRDPAFREREREQQKSRLLVKRSADKLPIALDVSSSSSSMLTGTSTSIVSSQASSQLALPPPPHHQALPLQSHMPLPSSSSRPQSQQPPPSSQQHGKGVPLTNCLVPHDMPKQRGATALYGHLQRIVGYHNLLQGRPHPEDPGSSFKSPYFAGEPSGGLMARRMGGPQGHHGGSSKAVVPAGAGRQKSFLNGGPCHPLGEAFASSYPIMRDQGLSLTGPQPCGVPDGPPLLHAATNADAGRNSHLALLGSETEMLPSVPDCPECLEAQRERSQCGICQGQEQQQLAAAGSSGRSSGRRRSSRQSTERFRCTVCAKEFGMKHHLKEHYKSHGDRNLCCPHCDYRTCYGYALRRHVIIRHDRPAARQAQVIQQLTVQC